MRKSRKQENYQYEPKFVLKAKILNIIFFASIYGSKVSIWRFLTKKDNFVAIFDQKATILWLFLTKKRQFGDFW